MVKAKFFEKGKEYSKGAKAPKLSVNTSSEAEEGRSSPATTVEVKPESTLPSPKNPNPVMAWAQSFYAPIATKGGKSRRKHKRKTRRTRNHRR